MPSARGPHVVDVTIDGGVTDPQWRAELLPTATNQVSPLRKESSLIGVSVIFQVVSNIMSFFSRF